MGRLLSAPYGSGVQPYRESRCLPSTTDLPGGQERSERSPRSNRSVIEHESRPLSIS
ncbi:MAG TPA: hypothetical protein VKB33_03230 [Nitrospira sp.]|nr:hypothetical protein [Nitrospira sp.]